MNLSARLDPQANREPAIGSVAYPLREFEVSLPPGLRRFGESVRASVMGSDEHPVVVLLGGISANRFPCRDANGGRGWWNGVAGEGSAVEPRKFRILGLDFAADGTGQIAPSTADQAAVICAVLDTIRVDRAYAIVGASYGGMAALSLGEHFADRAEKLVIVSAPADPHPVATAVRELQRRIVALGLARGAGGEGLSLARGLAMLTYRSPAEFEERFEGGTESEDALARSDPGAYLHARGQAFRSVMSPERFLSLSASIDRHRVNPEKINLPALLIGSTTDQLVPPDQMTELADRYGGPSSLHLLPSLYGHDMFLKQAGQLSALIGPFLGSKS
jgi:homoserine O-acetyltransferase/O-succinyltransferase